MDVHLRQRICYLLSRLRVHSPDCVHCNSRQTCWDDTVRRLDELDARGQSTLKSGGQREKTQPHHPEFRKLRSASGAIGLHLRQIRGKA